MSKFNVSESIKAQAKLCKEKQLPHFAPSNGVCWSCGKNIYEPDDRGFGITTETAGKELITGCPHCCRSYCD